MPPYLRYRKEQSTTSEEDLKEVGIATTWRIYLHPLCAIQHVCDIGYGR